MNKFKIGDKVRLISFPDGSCGVPIGSIGFVTEVGLFYGIDFGEIGTNGIIFCAASEIAPVNDESQTNEESNKICFNDSHEYVYQLGVKFAESVKQNGMLGLVTPTDALKFIGTESNKLRGFFIAGFDSVA